MKLLIKLVLLGGIFSNALLASNAIAWGEDGHQVTGEIAWHYLTPEVRREVAALLQIKGEATLAEATTWADRIRSNDAYDWAAPLHYVSLPKDWHDYDAKRDCPPTGCILSALTQFETILRDDSAKPEQRAEALLFVAHFVGDLHQPLHTGLAADRGGNDIQVEFFGYATNLHALWDVYLPAGFVRDWKDYAQRQPGMISAEQRSAWLDSTMVDWAAESQRLVHEHAYTSEVNLGEAYYLDNREIVEQRLRQSGVRLAGILNSALAQPLN